MARPCASPAQHRAGSNPGRRRDTMLNIMPSGLAARIAPPTMTGILAAGFATLRRRVALLRRRAEERRYLLALAERELRDIGITRYDAVIEATKPWWKP